MRYHSTGGSHISSPDTSPEAGGINQYFFRPIPPIKPNTCPLAEVGASQMTLGSSFATRAMLLLYSMTGYGPSDSTDRDAKVLKSSQTCHTERRRDSPLGVSTLYRLRTRPE